MKNERYHPEDELERRLRSGLGDFAPQASEQLWAGIERRLPERRRRPLAWWWLGVGLTVLFAGVAYRLLEKRHTETRPSDHPVTASDRLLYPEAQKNLPLPQTTACSRQIMAQSVAKNAPNTAGVFSIAYAKADSTFTGEKEENAVSSRSSYSDMPFLPHNCPIFQADKRILPLAITGVPVLDKVKEYPAVPVEKARISPGKIRHNRFYAGMIAGPVWQWEARNPHSAHSAVSVHTRGSAFGWQTGLAAGFNLNSQWSIYSGLWRQTTGSSVLHHATLRLKDGVLIPPVNYTDPNSYAFEYALPSGGDVTNVRVQISEIDHQTTMSDDEPFTLSMQTTHRSTDWAIPLAVQHRFGRGRWQIDLQAGSLLGIRAEREVQVDHFTEQCADLCYAIGYAPEFTVQDKEKMSISWMAGANLGCRIAPRWTIGFNPVFFGNNGQKSLTLHTTTRFEF